MDWFRWWHGAYDDPKFGLIAQETGIPRAAIIGLWCALLELASRSEKRGTIQNLDEEVLAFHLGIDVVTPCNAMKRRGLLHVTDGVLYVTKWDDRQPKREREDSSADRVKKHRANKKQTLTNSESHVTPCNASVTQETPRLEKIREYKTIPPNSRFAEFWEAYPKKVGKKKTLEIWRAKKLDSLADSILSGLGEYKSLCKPGYILDPERFLKNERWTDERHASPINGNPFEGAI